MKEENVAINIKSKISSLSWWKSVAGSLISTVLGIALTLGIANLVDRQKDKRQARDMMFNVVKCAEDDAKSLGQYDTLRINELQASMRLIMATWDKDNFAKMPDDTLTAYLRKSYDFARFTNYSASLESYFYGSQMMHQFNNPEVYSYFAAFVEYDKSVAADINSLHEAASKLKQTVTSRKFQKDISIHDLVKELIADGTLPDYLAFLENVNLKSKISGCSQMFDNMLLQMGATKEEYEKYKSRNSIVDEDRVKKLNF